MKERNTKQKETIINFLSSTKTHPTIYEIYDTLKKDNPSIGRATIYRNVAKLVQNGIVRKITTKDGIDHYDGNIIDHTHFHCTSCNKIVDIISKSITNEILNLEREYNIEISNYELLLRGKCMECITKYHERKGELN